MSGVEVVAAAAAVSLVTSAASAYQQVKTANATASAQNKQIREQQVELRLQQNQASIERLKSLQQILATEEVTFGARNIAGSSGTVRAITMGNMADFYADENADRLNFSAKQLALARQNEINYAQRRAQVFNAATGFIKEGAGTVMAAYGVPSSSLLNSSKGTANVAGSSGAQNYLEKQSKQFDLNA